MQIKKPIYNRIKAALADNKKSSKWLAEKLNKDKSTVSRWCSNEMQPTLETIFEIAELLNMSPRDLLSDGSQK
jgi:transcriptional regulator with XRE-family HTH domain